MSQCQISPKKESGAPCFLRGIVLTALSLSMAAITSAYYKTGVDGGRVHSAHFWLAQTRAQQPAGE